MIRFAILWLLAGLIALFGGHQLQAQTAIEKDVEIGKNLLVAAMRMDRNLIRASNLVNEEYIPGVGALYMIYNSPIGFFEGGVLGFETTTNAARIASNNLRAMERNIMEIENQALAMSVGSNVRSSSNPLLVLDGRVMPNSNLSGINLQDVERMEVLKGDAAEKQFGSRARNGVISIITKNPREEGVIELEIEVEKPNTVSPFTKNLDEFTLNFMADHSFLFAQLPKDEHFIIVHQERTTTSNVSGVSVVGYNPRIKNSRREFKLSASDIKDFQSGKIDREALKNKISINTEESKPIGEDVVLFANVIHSLYPQAPNTGTFFSTAPPVVESMPFQNLTLNWRVYSSQPMGENRFQMVTFDTEGKTFTLAQRNATLEKHYPEFIAKLKENMIDYGRTLRSLEAEQSLRMKLELTNCDCKMPSAVSLEMKIKDLMEYSKGTLSRADALKRITVKEE